MGAVVHFSGAGTGYSEEWGTEPAHTFVASMDSDRLPVLRDFLAIDADEYHQDAIGLTVGTFELVTAEEN